MFWQTAKDIDSLSRLQRRKRAAKDFEDCLVAVLIIDLITLKHSSTLELP